MEEKKDYKLYLDTATLAGKLMLQNGAEIYRVEDTIQRIFRDQLLGHEGNIPRRRLVFLRIRETESVREMGVFHAQLRRLLIHLVHKLALAPRHIFRHGHRRIVT